MDSTRNHATPTRTWALWLTATITSFVLLEVYAVGSRRIPTLSHCLRVWLGIAPARRHRTLASIAFAAFWTWLVAHIALGIGPNLDRHH